MENDTTPNNETPAVDAQADEKTLSQDTSAADAGTDVAPTPIPTPLPTESHASTKKAKLSAALIAGVALLMLLVGLGVGFGVAQMTAPKPTQNAVDLPAPQQTADKELTVPEGATVIAECAKGRGKQYVLPKDIPQGPVYNVYNGKVIGIEYMLGQQDVLSSKDYLDLPLQGVKYDHINIGLLSKGHSGYPDPHYHVDIFTISHEEALKITCQ